MIDVDSDLANADWPKRTDDRRKSLMPSVFPQSRSMPEIRHPGHADQTSHGSWATGVARAVGFGEGDTVNVIGGSRPSTGYVVARKSGGEFAPGVSNGITMSAHTFFGPHGPRQLAQYVQARKSALDGDTMVGIWHDTAHREVALDLVEVVQDRGYAVALGSANDQQAIYHIDSGTVIDTGGSGDRSVHGDHDRRPALGGGRPGGVGRSGDQHRALYDLADLRFNPNQPRDADGKWGSGGAAAPLVADRMIRFDEGETVPEWSLAHLTTVERAESIMREGFRPGDADTLGGSQWEIPGAVHAGRWGSPLMEYMASEYDEMHDDPRAVVLVHVRPGARVFDASKVDWRTVNFIRLTHPDLADAVENDAQGRRFGVDPKQALARAVREQDFDGIDYGSDDELVLWPSRSRRSMHDYDLADLRFNPNQPRDSHGRWGSGSGATTWEATEQNDTVIDADGITRRIGGVEPVDYDTLPDRARQHVQAYVDKYGIDVDGMADDIVASFDNESNAERGMPWYADELQADARGFAREFDVPIDVATATIAITSARNTWVLNDGVTTPNSDTARAYLRDWRAGRYDGMSAAEAAATVKSGDYIQQEGFGANVVAMLKGERSVADAVTGAKRTSFFNNGMDPYGSTSITNDVWMTHFMVRRSSGSTTVDPASGETRVTPGLTDSQVQSALSVPPPAYLTGIGLRQSPAYVVLSTATLRAHRRLVESGRIPPDSVPSGVQATAWMADPGGMTQ